MARGGHVILSEIAFWGETARVGRPTANLVIVFETFKRSHNLKAWLRFAPWRRKIFLASYSGPAEKNGVAWILT